MLTSRFFRRLFIPYLLLICAATGAVGAFAAVRMRGSYLQNIRLALSNESTLVGSLLDRDLASERIEGIEPRVQELAGQLNCRITIIAEDGRVLGDSEADPK